VNDFPLSAKRVSHFTLNATIYGRKRKRFPTQVHGWTFKMRVTPTVSSYIGISKLEEEYYIGNLSLNRATLCAVYSNISLCMRVNLPT